MEAGGADVAPRRAAASADCGRGVGHSWRDAGHCTAAARSRGGWPQRRRSNAKHAAAAAGAVSAGVVVASQGRAGQHATGDIVDAVVTRAGYGGQGCVVGGRRKPAATASKPAQSLGAGSRHHRLPLRVNDGRLRGQKRGSSSGH